MTDPAGRVRIPLPELVQHVVREYSLPADAQWSVLTTGYEDCNILLSPGAASRPVPGQRTHGADDSSHYPFGIVMKVFAVDRPHWVARRTAGLIETARAAGVRHPRLHPDSAGRLVHEHDGHQLILMDLAPGRTFYDLGRPPRRPELASVVEQAALLHSVDAHPRAVPDPWAIANLVPLAGQVDALLDGEQRRLVASAISEIESLDLAALPEALIHADLTAGNVLAGADGTVSILDFALANRWPRLQEIAVVAASLLHGSPEPVPARMSLVATMYSSLAPLTPAEWSALDAFGRAAAAMELLGGLAQWQRGDRGAETRSLIDIGTAGLRDYA